MDFRPTPRGVLLPFALPKTKVTQDAVLDLGFIAKREKLLLLIDVSLIRVRNEWEVVSSLTAI